MSRRRTGYILCQHLYKRVSDSTWCIYCGAITQCLDHFTPLIVAYALADVGVKFGRKILVPACSDCNVIAGTEVLKTIAQKRRFIQNRLRVKHKKLLRSPTWTQVELEKLSPNLRARVQFDLNLKAEIQRRIAWRNSADLIRVRIAEEALARPEPGQNTVMSDASSKQLTQEEKSFFARRVPRLRFRNSVDREFYAWIVKDYGQKEAIKIYLATEPSSY